MDTAARRDRLVRLLRRRDSVTVAEVAAQLQVSRRTILRDLAALRVRGFSIDGEGGPGGGVRLDPHSVLLSTQLATDEVVALILSVASIRAARWMPFASRADTALAKIEAVLPADRVRELRHVAGRILVGEPASSSPGPMGAIDPALLATFERAFTRHRVLVFSYIDRAGRRSRRRVEPHALLVRAPLWYIVAWDVDKDAARLFRMDRIRRPVVRDDEGFGPRPFGVVSGVCPDAVGASRRGVGLTRQSHRPSPPAHGR